MKNNKIGNKYLEQCKYYYNYLLKEGIYTKNKYLTGIKKLEKGIPVQYVIGNVDFYGNKILVNKNVLIPRFETEQLIEQTKKYINTYFSKDIDIIDLGTGSGCIAITLAKEYPLSKIVGYDISKKALNIAKKNNKKNNTNVIFKKKDITKSIIGKYDIVISNPPYISKNEIIDEIVKENEPKEALYADNNGLYFYEKILENIKPNLKEKYLIAFEIGYTQGKEIIKISKRNFPKSNVYVKKDYQGKDRFAFITNIKIE